MVGYLTSARKPFCRFLELRNLEKLFELVERVEANKIVVGLEEKKKKRRESRWRLEVAGRRKLVGGGLPLP